MSENSFLRSSERLLDSSVDIVGGIDWGILRVLGEILGRELEGSHIRIEARGLNRLRVVVSDGRLELRLDYSLVALLLRGLRMNDLVVSLLTKLLGLDNIALRLGVDDRLGGLLGLDVVALRLGDLLLLGLGVVGLELSVGLGTLNELGLGMAGNLLDLMLRDIALLVVGGLVVDLLLRGIDFGLVLDESGGALGNILNLLLEVVHLGRWLFQDLNLGDLLLLLDVDNLLLWLLDLLNRGLLLVRVDDDRLGDVALLRDVLDLGGVLFANDEWLEVDDHVVVG